jgi:CRP/FNR family cyclic AMP-dependent transcriptional regulator
MDAEITRQAPWAVRARELEVRPFDAALGAELLVRLWGADRFVAALSVSELTRLSEYLHFVRVAADKEVIGQNEQGDFMIVVLEGTVLVDRVQSQGGRVRLAEAHEGEVLGEMSLLDSGARFSSCTTLTACTLAVIDSHGLDELTQYEPRLGLAVMGSLSRRLSLRLRQVSSRLSALLSGR